MRALQTTLLLAMALLPGIAGAFDHSHSGFTTILKTHVRQGRVDYRALKVSPDELNRYEGELAAVTRQEFGSWTRDQQVAYLINLYNARTISLILENHPITSIKRIGLLPGAAWRKEFIPLFGKTVSLNHLEHGLLRANYKLPEIHFALVCAAKGCPPLRSEAYIAQNLVNQLQDQGRRFLGNATKNRIDLPNRRIYLSPIFKWFAEDFEGESGSVTDYLRAFLPKETATKVTKSFEIHYTDYDWSLNSTEN
jgi:hypothetical protein